MNASAPPALLVSGQQKITTDHLQRLAYIYIRQSSPKQVLHNTESQRYQRLLAERAASLGWKTTRIRVIDTDLARSGAESASRAGFQELVAEVSLGHVGIIFGYEVSRLARNNADWYYLLDLAAVFDTLIADNDGIYNPRLYNDRLLLGLKGTMSEAELHLLRQRLVAGRLNKVRRGEYRQRLPTGLVRLPDGAVVKHPDEQVQHALEFVFVTFAELGSAHGVTRYLRQEEVLLPRRQTNGPHAGEIVWKPASSAAIREILHNPAYAGAFAYGRRQTDPTKQRPGQPGTGHVAKPMEEWIHLQQDVYPAYITWEQYLANQERLRQNSPQFGATRGAAREGTALLQGLTVCGVCGRRTHVKYKYSPLYVCRGVEEYGEPTCLRVRGPIVDEVVVAAFFEALAPAQLDALAAVMEAQHAEQSRLTQQWEERLKRARYEAHLAQRQYNAVDPDNRLVAAELERRWEEKLLQLQETEEAYTRFQQTPAPFELTAARREQFRHISEALPELWPSISNTDKKELLRTLIAKVILRRDIQDQVEIKIVWVSGHYTCASAQVPIQRQEDVTGYTELVARIKDLWEAGVSDAEAAEQLTTEGFHTARSVGVTVEAVRKIRRKHNWLLPAAQQRGALEVDGALTTRGLAARLNADQKWIYRCICNGTIDARYVRRHPQSNFFLIDDDPDLIAQLRTLLTETRQA